MQSYIYIGCATFIYTQKGLTRVLTKHTHKFRSKSPSGQMYTLICEMFTKFCRPHWFHIYLCDVHIVLSLILICLMFTYCSKAQAFWLLGEEDLARPGLNISCSLEGARGRKSDVSFPSNIFLWIFLWIFFEYFFEYFFE